MGNPDNINVYGHRWVYNQIKPAVEPRVVSAFRMLWPTDLVMHEPAHHWWWSLDYFYEAGARFCGDADGKNWRDRTPGVAHLYRPNARFWHSATKSPKAVDACYMSLYGGDAANLGNLVPTGMNFAQFDDPDHLYAERQLEIINIGRSYQDRGFLRSQGVLYQILDLLFGARQLRPGVYVIEKERAGEEGEVLVTNARTYLQKNLCEAVRIGDVARHLGVSVSVLERRYKLRTGESPLKTLIRLRVERAKESMIRGATVKESAEAAGFYDAYHLSRVFKQVEGQRPTEFLRRLRGGSSKI